MSWKFASIIAVSLTFLLSGRAAGQQSAPDRLICDPDESTPTSSPGPGGCEWWYDTGWCVPRYDLVFDGSEEKVSARETLPPCACGWYPETAPCPTCPPNMLTVTMLDTLTWAMSATSGSQHALTLKGHMLVEIGYSYALSQSEMQSLSGTHTVSVAYALPRQPIMCFTRYYRQSWIRRTRTEKLYYDWTFSWRAWCNGVPSGTMTTTSCAQLMASGTMVWNTLPNYEWVPQEPPCGGIPIGSPDPYGGKRETPCCAEVCWPPPSPAHPCCGCAYVP